jgi:hypothetical protein
VSGEGDPRFDLRMRSRLPPLRRPTYAPGHVLRVESLPPIIPPPMRRERGCETTAWQPRAVVIPPPVPSGSTLPHEAEDAPDASGLPHEADGEV